MMMEKKLTALFDFQKFERSSDLDEVIRQVHARYGMQQNVKELSLTEMGFASAAGMQVSDPEKPWRK